MLIDLDTYRHRLRQAPRGRTCPSWGRRKLHTTLLLPRAIFPLATIRQPFILIPHFETRLPFPSLLSPDLNLCPLQVQWHLPRLFRPTTPTLDPLNLAHHRRAQVLKSLHLPLLLVRPLRLPRPYQPLSTWRLSGHCSPANDFDTQMRSPERFGNTSDVWPIPASPDSHPTLLNFERSLWHLVPSRLHPTKKRWRTTGSTLSR